MKGHYPSKLRVTKFATKQKNSFPMMGPKALLTCTQLEVLLAVILSLLSPQKQKAFFPPYPSNMTKHKSDMALEKKKKNLISDFLILLSNK